MRTQLRKYSIELSIIVVFGLFILLLNSGINWLLQFNAWFTEIRPEVAPKFQNGITIFLSIFIEGVPFILIGVLVSSLIHIFVQEEHIWRYIPRQPILSIPIASVLGLVLPICECGIVPIVRRLIQKGLPPYVAITFLLAAPIVNPVTILSTYLAFADLGMHTALARTLLGAMIAILMGFIFCFVFMNRSVLRIDQNQSSCDVHCDHDHQQAENTNHLHHDPSHDHGEVSHHEHTHHPSSMFYRMKHALYHAVFEWMNMGKFFVFGVAIAAIFQTTIGLSVLRQTISSEWWAVFLLMFLAYVLSICSSADAFVAASFRTFVDQSALLAFLVFGPMMDIKNVMMLLSAFRLPVVLFLLIGCMILTYTTVILLF
ncbi:hypothetical protein SAMN05444392_10936 [Seinonella peptonophila]|uniref:Permease n=1 Tax=Seinonella peptonophila TaxID=112248 RepID=A0A1M4ZGT0_9BACL|nr:permease [Seinonella peptonophila]SHF17007.1 hypothetical protein SAMN05444392_10936 [Seinonella peptonophila]